MRHIMFVHPSVIRPCGPDSSLYQLVSRLDRKAFQLYLVVPQSTALVKKYSPYVNRIFVIPEASFVSEPRSLREFVKLLFRNSLAVGRVRKVLKQCEIELVHTNVESSWIVGLAARSLGIRSLMHIRGLAALNSKWRSLIVPVFMRLASEQFVAVSASVAEMYFQGGIPKKHIYTIYNGVDLNEFRPQRDHDFLSREYRLQTDAIVIGAVGSADPRKGWAYLVMACALLRKKYPTLRCFFVGDYDHDASRSQLWRGEYSYIELIMSLVQSLQLQDSVYFMGQQERMADIYASLDLLVQPSLTEAGPRAVLEGLAAGIPVVATAVGGNADYVIAGVTGHLVPPRDQYGLAEAVSQLLSSPQKRIRMSSMARAVAQEKYSVETHVAKIENVYNQMLLGFD